jgi:hypothetical protein
MTSGRVIHVGWGGWGKAYGAHVIVDDGAGHRFGYMHMSRTSVGNGASVSAGQVIGAVGTTGNSTGPHLHIDARVAPFAYNNRIINPADFFGASGGAPAGGGGGGGAATYLSKLRFGQKDSDSVRNLQRALNGHKLQGGHNLPITGNYGPQTDLEVRLCQQQHGLGNDPAGGSNVGPKQAAHLGLPGVRP